MELHGAPQCPRAHGLGAFLRQVGRPAPYRETGKPRCDVCVCCAASRGSVCRGPCPGVLHPSLNCTLRLACTHPPPLPSPPIMCHARAMQVDGPMSMPDVGSARSRQSSAASIANPPGCPPCQPGEATEESGSSPSSSGVTTGSQGQRTEHRPWSGKTLWGPGAGLPDLQETDAEAGPDF